MTENKFEFIGQARAVSLLKNSVTGGTSPHAWLFTGSEHIGKMRLALHLACMLNCTEENRPCGACTSCEKIIRGTHADVNIIGLAHNENETEAKLIGIDQVRDVLHSASLPPFEGRHRVFIVNNADLLSVDAANCLLKTLEEPADRVAFILLTVNERLLLETIVSRCQRLELLPVPAEVITAALIEQHGVEKDRAALLGRLAQGRPGWAIGAISDTSVLEEREAGLEKLSEIIHGDCQTRFAWSADVASRFSRDRGQVYRLLEAWTGYWRDMMLVKLGCHGMITNIDREAEIDGLAAKCRLPAIRRCIRDIESAADHLKRNANPRLALDVLMIDIPVFKGGKAGQPQTEPVS